MVPGPRTPRPQAYGALRGARQVQRNGAVGLLLGRRLRVDPYALEVIARAVEEPPRRRARTPIRSASKYSVRDLLSETSVENMLSNSECSTT